MENQVHLEIAEISGKKKDKIVQAFSALKEIREDNIACHIIEGIFLGSCRAAANKEGLKSLTITHILTVANGICPAHPDDFTYKVVNVRDTVDTDLAQHFSECFDFINESRRTGGRVLVHCFAGISRSVTVVVAYMMKRYNMPLCEAMNHVRARRPRANPNMFFYKQLINFERSIPRTESSYLNCDFDASQHMEI